MMRIVSLVASILLGVTAGVAIADLRDDPEAAASQHLDPLDLGIDLVNLDCDGRSILVLDGSDSRPELLPAVADHPDAKYLATADSCATLYEETDRETPEYVLYLGPYDSAIPPCEKRLGDEGRGTLVTRLDASNTTLVKCVCALPLLHRPDAWPVIRPGEVLDLRQTLFLRQLQQMLIDNGQLAMRRPSEQYDEKTLAAVNGLLERRSQVPDGVVDVDTWRIVRSSLCSSYGF